MGSPFHRGPYTPSVLGTQGMHISLRGIGTPIPITLVIWGWGCIKTGSPHIPATPVGILLMTLYHMHHYTIQLLGIWSNDKTCPPISYILESQMEDVYQQSMKHNVSAVCSQTNQHKLPHKTLTRQIYNISNDKLITMVMCDTCDWR